MRFKLVDLDRLVVDSLVVRTYKSRPFRENTKKHKPLLSSLLKEYTPRRSDGVKWFVTQCLYARACGAEAMSVMLKSSYWSGNACGIGAKQVSKFIDWLEENEYIDIYVGYKQHWKGNGEGQRTILLFKDKLLLLLNECGVDVKRPPLDELIVCKDRKTKEPKSYHSTKHMVKEREDMLRYNRSLNNVEITFCGKPVATVEYFRSFVDDHTKGGRLYVNGGGIQLIAGRHRAKYLRFNGSPVVELDYSSNHPNILYEYKRLDWIDNGNEMAFEKVLGDDFKPYAVSLPFLTIDTMLLAKHRIAIDNPNYDPVRNLTKYMLLICLNSRDESTAYHAIRNELAYDKKLVDTERQYHGIVGSVDIKRCVGALKEHNVFIQDKFFSDVGVSLQKVDSEIAMKVIDKVLQQDYTLLCYHDSFIVEQAAEDLLRQAMKEAWKEQIGDNVFCTVSKSNK